MTTIDLIDPAPSRRKPEWLKMRLPSGGAYEDVRNEVKGLGLHTVCEEARCPNIGECWGNRTATFMILGDVCTRACRYCAVTSGKPYELDLSEPLHVAQAVSRMGLKHAVVTSVDRDDLPDFGAGHFAATIRSIRRLNPDCAIEVLTPDFQADEAALGTVLAVRPDIFNHNIETVERIFRRVRPGRSNYHKSLHVLARAKELNPGGLTKSGFMVGLGETLDEIKQTMRDLRDNDVDIITAGQYLRPTQKHMPIERYVHPNEFAEIKEYGLQLGFAHVESGPLVRSSYHAHEQTELIRGVRGQERLPSKVER